MTGCSPAWRSRSSSRCCWASPSVIDRLSSAASLGIPRAFADAVARVAQLSQCRDGRTSRAAGANLECWLWPSCERQIGVDGLAAFATAVGPIEAIPETSGAERVVADDFGSAPTQALAIGVQSVLSWPCGQIPQPKPGGLPTALSAPRGTGRRLLVLTAGLVRYFYRRYTTAQVVASVSQ